MNISIPNLKDSICFNINKLFIIYNNDIKLQQYAHANNNDNKTNFNSMLQ
jgi:hypothetical protein